jgi:hypothetical protein
MNDRRYINVGFIPEVNKLVRRKRMWQHGDLSRRVALALSTVDLDTVELVVLVRSSPKLTQTQVGLPSELFLHSKARAAVRACLMNVLVNSALLVYLKMQNATA